MGNPPAEGEPTKNHLIQNEEKQKEIASARKSLKVTQPDDDIIAPSTLHKVLDQTVAESAGEQPRKLTSNVRFAFNDLPQRNTLLVNNRNKANRGHGRTQSSNIWNTPTVSSKPKDKDSQPKSSTDDASSLSLCVVMPWLTLFEANKKCEEDCSVGLNRPQKIKQLGSATIEDLLRNNSMLLAMARSTGTITDLHQYNSGDDHKNPAFVSESEEYKEDHSNAEAGEYKDDHSNSSIRRFVMGNSGHFTKNALAKKNRLDAKSLLLCDGEQKPSSNTELSHSQQYCCGNPQLISALFEDCTPSLSCGDLDAGDQIFLHQQIEGFEAFHDSNCLTRPCFVIGASSATSNCSLLAKCFFVLKNNCSNVWKRPVFLSFGRTWANRFHPFCFEYLIFE